jgi:cell fate regulator YaaT (PSP1 superfamily)
MGCGQCSTGGCGSVRPVISGEESNQVAASGCQSKGGCGSGGCTKINSFDWLGNMSLPSSMRYDVIEIKFKGGNKEYFRNSKQFELYTGDFVVCEMPNGYHIGTVSLQGELVRLQLIKKKIKDDKSLRKIIRVANESDLHKHEQAINRDLSTMYRSRELIQQMKLKMKLSDVEFQSDNTKATFYYSADDRVDFRELIKILAGEFKIRVEMKQISLRQEASRIGGLGSCGRELCCSTWLTDFKPIPTSAARYQNLSLNPAKLAGQCGRLKCCLNYELETYIDALSDIPKIDRPLQTEKGLATLQKTDIFRRLMWFSYEKDSNWYPIPCTQVTDIMEMNKRGEKPVSIVEMVTIDEVVAETTLNNDLAQLDKRLANKGSGGSKPKRNRKRNRNRSPKGKGSKPNN